MPEELIKEDNFKSASNKYLNEVGTEAYQPLSSLLTKIKNLWTCNTIISSAELS